MKAQVLCALVVLALASSALADCVTRDRVAVPLENLINRWYAVYLMSGLESNTGCLYAEFKGNGDGSVTLITYKVFKDGLSSTMTSTLTEIEPGIFNRVFEDGTSLTMIITSLSDFVEGAYKMSYVMCEDGNPIPQRYGFVTNIMYPEWCLADFSEDLAKVEKSYKMKNLLLIENVCDPFTYVTVASPPSYKK